VTRRILGSAWWGRVHLQRHHCLWGWPRQPDRRRRAERQGERERPRVGLRGDRGEAALLRLIELARPLDHSTCQIVIRDLRNLGILLRLDHMRINTL
jgi:hypothetical protein